MTSDDLVNAAPVSSEPVHEGRVGMEQPTKDSHIVIVPGILQARRDGRMSVI